VTGPGANSMPNWSKSFQEAFCEHFGCEPEQYAPKALRKVLPWRVRLIRPFLSVLYPGYFRPDFELVEMLADARSWSDVNAALGAFSSNNRLRGGFYRNSLKLRASGGRASNLVTRMMGSRDVAAASKG
jgi:hypothetical protein